MNNTGPWGWHRHSSPAREPAGNWPNVRGARRFMIGIFVLLFGMPVLLAALLTAAFAGWTGAAVAAIIGLVVLAAGVLLARFVFRIVHAVNELVSATASLADGDYGTRMRRSDSPAFGPVTRSFNDMAKRLEVSDDLRRRLLADVGHELRTPLTIIRGELEAMADGVRALNEREVRRLLVDVAGMERLLDDLKTLSATEAGVLDLYPESTDLVALVELVVDRFRPEAGSRNIIITFEPGPDPIELDVDPFRVSEVVSNLMANALRAVGSDGTIVIKTLVEGEREAERLAVVSVEDDGVGIPDDQLDAVFDRFHRGSESDGSGLGLTISRDLVEAHQGSITAASTEGVRTCMTIRLPILIASEVN